MERECYSEILFEFFLQIFRANDSCDNIKIITEQSLGDGRLIVIPREANYQFRNESNYSFHINFNKPSFR